MNRPPFCATHSRNLIIYDDQKRRHTLGVYIRTYAHVEAFITKSLDAKRLTDRTTDLIHTEVNFPV